MTTLTITPGSSSTGVARVLLSLSGPADEVGTVYRAGEDGRFEPVRVATDVVLAGGLWTGYDYDAPLDETIAYRYVDESGTATAAEETSLDSGGSPWLVSPARPDGSLPLVVLDWGRATLPSQGQEFAVIGRREVVLVSSRRGGSSRTITVATTGPETDALTALVESGRPLLLKGSARERARTRWVSIGDVERESFEIDLDEFVVWTLPITDVAAPSGAAIPATTYADASAAFGSYGAASLTAPTYAIRTSGAYVL